MFCRVKGVLGDEKITSKKILNTLPNLLKVMKFGVFVQNDEMQKICDFFYISGNSLLANYESVNFFHLLTTEWGYKTWQDVPRWLHYILELLQTFLSLEKEYVFLIQDGCRMRKVEQV